MAPEISDRLTLTNDGQGDSPVGGVAALHLFQNHLTIKEIAKQLKVSENKARTLFSDYPGVVKIKSPQRRSRRTYTLLRVPLTVFAAWHHEHSRGSLNEIQRGRRVV